MEDVGSNHLGALSGKSAMSIRAKNVPLPTNVIPSTKPPRTPTSNPRRRSRFASTNGWSPVE